jgi:hypothetical protein
MDAAKQNRLERLRKLAAASNDKIQDPETLLKRVDGLQEFEDRFKRFFLKSNISNEDDALKKFLRDYREDDKQVSPYLPKIPRDRFTAFAAMFFNNLQKLSVKDFENDPPPALRLDELWNGLMAFGRFRRKDYVPTSKQYMTDLQWVNSKRAGGTSRRSGSLKSPASLLGVKRWSESVEIELLRHRDFFEALFIGFMIGHGYGDGNWRDKFGKVLGGKGFKILSTAVEADPYAHQGKISFDDDSEALFNGIRLPDSVMWQLANESKDKDEQEKWAKHFRKLQPLKKSKKG